MPSPISIGAALRPSAFNDDFVCGTPHKLPFPPPPPFGGRLADVIAGALQCPPVPQPSIGDVIAGALQCPPGGMPPGMGGGSLADRLHDLLGCPPMRLGTQVGSEG